MISIACELSEFSAWAKLASFGLLTQILNILQATSLQVDYCSNWCVTRFTSNNYTRTGDDAALKGSKEVILICRPQAKQKLALAMKTPVWQVLGGWENMMWRISKCLSWFYLLHSKKWNQHLCEVKYIEKSALK